MKTKEAIKFIREMLKGYYAPSLYAPRYKQVIKLLQCGEENEKYKNMWEEHKEGIIYLSGDAHYKGAKILMDRMEQKYFPK